MFSAQLINNNPSAAVSPEIQVDVFDVDGNLLGFGTNVLFGSVQPSDLRSVSVSIPTIFPEDIGNFEFGVISVDDPSHPVDPTTGFLAGFAFRDEDRSLQFQMEVTNNRSRTASRVRIAVTLYNEEGFFLGTTSGQVFGLAPGETDLVSFGAGVDGAVTFEVLRPSASFLEAP